METNAVETRLKALGLYAGAIDGIAGPKLLAAVKAFQTSHGLQSDGLVGPLTEKALGLADSQELHQVLTAGAQLPADVVFAARTAQRSWGVPASVTLAQFGLESAWGVKMPGDSKNPFGIKASPGQASVAARTREVVDGKSVFIEARFRKFASWQEAFAAHGQLLGTRPQYVMAQKVWEATGDVGEYVKALAKVYATDPRYADLIMSIIRNKNLTQYDVKVGQTVS